MCIRDRFLQLLFIAADHQLIIEYEHKLQQCPDKGGIRKRPGQQDKNGYDDMQDILPACIPVSYTHLHIACTFLFKLHMLILFILFFHQLSLSLCSIPRPYFKLLHNPHVLYINLYIYKHVYKRAFFLILMQKKTA